MATAEVVLNFVDRYFRYFIISSFLSCNFQYLLSSLVFVSPLRIIQSEFVPFLLTF